MSLASRLYHGETSYDFIGRRRRWYVLSGLIVLVSLVSILVRGFVFSVDFRGGDVFTLPRQGHSVADIRDAVAGTGLAKDPVVQQVGSDQIKVTTEPLTAQQVDTLRTLLAKRVGVPLDQLSTSSAGSRWGHQVTVKAIEGLLIFLVVVTAYIAVRFGESKMALAALIALVHDLVITAGVYSLVGFEVSPATVIALLTILGFSLYDTVVVFDKVRENTARIVTTARQTYSQAANTAVNQTLMRSINTSLIALLPVGALLFVGAGLLGAGTLKDLALAQFVGLASGAYSSIFVATPLLCEMKEREPAMRDLARRVARTGAGGRRNRPTAAARSEASGGAGSGEPAGGDPATTVAVLDRPGDEGPDERASAGAGTAFRPRPPDRPGKSSAAAKRARGSRGRPSGRRHR